MDNLARTITVIPAKPLNIQKSLSSQQLRVAAYCRVSTDDEEQMSSFETQIGYYTERITGNENWKMVGVFADEGITGTSAKKRGEFMKLMELCKKGKVDLVLTKSISRFSRNTLDAISYVRNLKSLGVGVMFEKENINTLYMSNEMAFTMLSAFAQAESESISENVKWGKRNSLKNGKIPFQYSKLLGYRKGADGRPEIIPEEADIVRRIYAMFLTGRSITQIKRELESDGIPSKSGKQDWSFSVLYYILKNERYIGDALLQKTYVENCLTKKVIKNNGELQQYYVTDNHEGIIPRGIFHRVQEEQARRSAKRKVADKNVKTEHGKYSGKYALSELIVCNECGTRYRRVTWARNGAKRIVWRCISRLEYGVKYCKNSPTIEEDKLHDAILNAMNRLIAGKAGLMGELSEILQHAALPDNDGFDRYNAERKIAELDSLLADLFNLCLKSPSEMARFEGELQKLSDEKAALISAVSEDDIRRSQASATSAKLAELAELLDDEKLDLTLYNDTLTRRLISSVKVLEPGKLLVVFKGGLEVEQDI